MIVCESEHIQTVKFILEESCNKRTPLEISVIWLIVWITNG